jgi:hypothetical protein
MGHNIVVSPSSEEFGGNVSSMCRGRGGSMLELIDFPRLKFLGGGRAVPGLHQIDGRFELFPPAKTCRRARLPHAWTLRHCTSFNGIPPSNHKSPI